MLISSCEDMLGSLKYPSLVRYYTEFLGEISKHRPLEKANGYPSRIGKCIKLHKFMPVSEKLVLQSNQTIIAPFDRNMLISKEIHGRLKEFSGKARATLRISGTPEKALSGKVNLLIRFKILKKNRFFEKQNIFLDKKLK